MAARGRLVAVSRVDSGGMGSVAVYHRQQGASNWFGEAVVIGSGTYAGDGFGQSLALFGDVLAIGGPMSDLAGTTAGAVWIFRRDPADGTWTEEAVILPPQPTAGARFGAGLALGARVVAVGAPGSDGSAGDVRLYRTAGGGAWQAAETELPGDLRQGDRLGAALALRGTHLLAGAAGRGNALLLELSGDRWGEPAWLSESSYPSAGLGTEVGFDGFGLAIALGRENGAVVRLRQLEGGGSELERLPVPAGPAGAVRIAGQAVVSAEPEGVVVTGSAVDRGWSRRTVPLELDHPADYRMATFGGLAVVADAESAKLVPLGEVCTWTNASRADPNYLNHNDNWSDPANWSCSGGHLTPESADTVVINEDDYGENMAIVDQATQIGDIQMGPALSRLLLGATLAASGSSSWAGGALESGQGPLVNNGDLSITGPNPHQMQEGVPYQNNGTTYWDDGDIEMLSGNWPVTIDNQGLFEVRTDHVITGSATTSTTTVHNGAVATLRKSAGAGTARLAGTVRLDNTDGAVEVLTGTLEAAAGGSLQGGDYNAGAGSALRFAGGTFEVNGTLAGSPDGSVELTTGATFESVNLTGGAASGRLDFQSAGFRWLGGRMGGTSATLFNDGLVTLAGPDDKLVRVGFENSASGTLVWNEGDIVLGENLFAYPARVVNSGTFEMNSGGRLRHVGAEGEIRVWNTASGVVEVASLSGVTTVDSTVGMHNEGGSLVVHNGILSLEGGGELLGGSYEAEAGATLRFAGGRFDVSGTMTGTPAGSVELVTGATFESTATPLEAANGRLDLDGVGFTWRGGRMGGVSLGLFNDGLLTLAGPDDKLIRKSFVNAGTMVWQDGDIILGDNLFTGYTGLQNDGVLELQGDDSLRHAGPVGTIELANTGTIRSTGAAGTTSIVDDVVLINDGGLIELAAGTLRPQYRFEHRAGSVIRGTATFDRSTATVLGFDGTTAPGLSPGTLTWIGTWQPSDAAPFEVELGGTNAGVDSDLLAVDGTGIANGILDVRLVDGFVPAVGDQVTIATCSGGCSGDFDQILAPEGIQLSVAVTSSEIRIEITDVAPSIVFADDFESGDLASWSGVAP